MTLLRLLVTREVPIISIVGVEVMTTTSSFDAIFEGFPTTSLPKHAGKPDYAAIKKFQQLLTEKSALKESDFDRG